MPRTMLVTQMTVLVYWLWWGSCHPQNHSTCEWLWWWTLGPWYYVPTPPDRSDSWLKLLSHWLETTKELRELSFCKWVIIFLANFHSTNGGIAVPQSVKKIIVRWVRLVGKIEISSIMNKDMYSKKFSKYLWELLADSFCIPSENIKWHKFIALAISKENFEWNDWWVASLAKTELLCIC